MQRDLDRARGLVTEIVAHCMDDALALNQVVRHGRKVRTPESAAVTRLLVFCTESVADLKEATQSIINTTYCLLGLPPAGVL